VAKISHIIRFTRPAPPPSLAVADDFV